MDKKLKEKWLKALRSGRYKQGTGVLYNTTTKTHCCLGVLCRVEGIRPRDGKFNGAYSYLPDDLAEEAGVNSEQQTVLASLNDAGVTFREIADHIESKF